MCFNLFFFASNSFNALSHITLTSSYSFYNYFYWSVKYIIESLIRSSISLKVLHDYLWVEWSYDSSKHFKQNWLYGDLQSKHKQKP